jgi:hypothetical protein
MEREIWAFRNPQFSASFRAEMADKLTAVFRNMISMQILSYAIGRPSQQVSVDSQNTELQYTKVVHQVRWLPPDPNDRSREIAPEPD